MQGALKQLGSPLEEELAEMHLLLQDLTHSILAITLWFQKYAPEANVQLSQEDFLISNSLMRDSIVQFVGCFDKTAQHKLNEQEVFGHIEGGIECFQWLKDIRDSYAAHKFGPLRQWVAGIIVSEDGIIMGTGNFGMPSWPFDKAQEQKIIRCMHTTRQYIETQIKTLENKLLSEAQKLTPEELSNLPNARTYALNSSEIRTSRKKLLDARKKAGK